MLSHIIRVVGSHFRGRRSPGWPALEKSWLRDFPRCAACGGTRGLQVHHIMPFHIDASKELDRSNLITLCMALGGPECHFRIGHGGNWKAYNPDVLIDAYVIKSYPASREATELKAKNSRILDAATGK